MKINEMIAVMQAFQEGKAIQSKRKPSCDMGRHVSEGDWGDDISPTWSWSQRDYRVKPVEPKRVWISFSPGPDHSVRATWQRKPDIDSESSAMVVVEFIELTPEVRVKLNL